MAITASVTNNQIIATVGETQIDVSVSGGVGPTGAAGPTGPAGPSYSLPTATASVLGGVKIGSGISIDGNGVISATGATPAWSDITGKPSTFAPSTHAHSQSDVTGLQSALDAKAPLASPTFNGTVSGITAAMVGLGSVDNTADASKPVSTAQAAADSAVASAAAADATTKANAAQAAAVQRANHTGTQAASTISDFSSAAVSAVTWTTLTGKPSFATVATTGAYADLTGTPSAYSLPAATASVLGGVKIGSGISIDGNGVISAAAGYTLPNATTSTLGGVIVGTGLAVASGTVSVSYGSSAGTACEGNDSRLSDARTPTAHTHATSDITWQAATGWNAFTAYAAGALVTREGVAYRAATAHTSGMTFNPLDWLAVTPLSFPASHIAAGVIDTARLGSGTANSTTYLRGDQTWATVSAGSTSASDLTSGTLANARMTTRARNSMNLYAWSSFR
jgi:hypothetical protein